MLEKVEKELYLDFVDVLIKPRISHNESRSDVVLRKDFSSFNKSYFINWKPIPIMSANMDTVTDTKVAFELVKNNLIAVLHKFVKKSEITELFDNIDIYNISNKDNPIDYRNVFFSRGTTENDKQKLIERLEEDSRIQSVCIDVANGYRNSVFKYAEILRNGICKDKILMFGNVATPDAVIEYQKIGIDIIKLGIGPGSACTTRVQTGVGVPQISVILNAKKDIENNSETLI
jgi:GMP reductase